MTERKAPTRPCPSCGKINHVRVLKCECGKVLRESQPQEQKIKTEEKTETPSIPNPHDFPGRGKTQCPSCKKYVGAKLTNCNLCNALLRPNKTEEVKTPAPSINPGKKFDGPGPGRKQCSNCKSYVGVRTLKCECGFEFAGKKDSGAEKVILEEKAPTLLKEGGPSPVPKSSAAPKSRPSTSFVTIPSAPSFLSLAKKVPKEEDKKPTKEQVFFFKEGQGKKFCPGCTKNDGKNIYVPVATRTCGRCGFFFEKKEKSKPFARKEVIEKLGKFFIYTKDHTFANYAVTNLEYQDREYLINIKGSNISLEELDAELCLLDQTQNLNNKHPDEVKAFICGLFKSITSVSWNWILTDEQFKEEQRLPQYLRLTSKNKSYNNTKAMWEHFCVTRNEFLKKNMFGAIGLKTPRYRIEGNKTVMLRG